MDPGRKIPSNMKKMSTKMLQIPWKMKGSNSKMLQYRWKAASSSKMLQIARKSDTKKEQNGKHNSQNKSGPNF